MNNQAEAPSSGVLSRRIRILAWLTLVSQAGIVITGALVRLTASGLGCPTWPRCTDQSYVNTPEMGIHGYIEFGNRTLTFVVAAIAVLTLIALWKIRRERRDLWTLAVVLLFAVPLQAVIGGITVLSNLNPWVVGLHFLASAIMVALATLMVRRVSDSGAAPARVVPPVVSRLGWAILALMIIVVVNGVMVTGAGPHSGDHGAARNGLDPTWITRLHAAPVYLLVAATVAALVLTARSRRAAGADQLAEPRRALMTLLIVELAQGAIGYTQHFLHLPVALVVLHMLGAVTLIAAAVAAVDSMYQRPPLMQLPDNGENTPSSASAETL
ncbi:COX15/CtaA family protein [Saxibacter everestensis]|uniref:COX15/CtaA family protein n=1 Tax=Saxibacter everestensis TaxID=2909229 RepID=A0ABY8QXI3_9MICO|nr:COX15/CtaA family protein [Brevibacteriaceae bacterium ZFBP1038]